jgi:hypothetical protein
VEFQFDRMSNAHYALVMIESRNCWTDFDEASRETTPRDREPIEMEFEDGEIIQGWFEGGIFSTDAGVIDNVLKERKSLPKRFRYLH